MKPLLFGIVLALAYRRVECQACPPDSSLFQTYRLDDNGIVQFCYFNWMPICSDAAVDPSTESVVCNFCGATDSCDVSPIESTPLTLFSAQKAVCSGTEESLNDCSTSPNDCSNSPYGIKVTCTPQDVQADEPGTMDVTPRTECPVNWFLSDVSGKCYRIIPEKMSRHRASEACRLQDEDANLANIESSDDMGFLLILIHNDEELIHMKKFWIGENDISSWYDSQSSSDSSNSDSSENSGSNNSSNERNRCANLLGIRKGYYQIHDASCSQKSAPICEMPAN